MQIVPRGDLPRLLRLAGLEPTSREFPDEAALCRLTIREREPPTFTSGPHRKVVYPDGRVEGPFPVGDRPVLSSFVAECFLRLEAAEVLTMVAEGTFWLNNKAQAAYLQKVDDAQRIARFLRQRGLTDRFQGGFRVRREQFAQILPRLAANTYAGGGDVLFAALSPAACRFTLLACHHFDLHAASPYSAPLETIAALAEPRGLVAESLAMLEIG